MVRIAAEVVLTGVVAVASLAATRDANRPELRSEPVACDSVRNLFVLSADTQWWIGGQPETQVVLADLAAAAELAPEAERLGIVRLGDVLEAYGLQLLHASPAVRVELIDTWNGLVGWANETCPAPGPNWACSYDGLAPAYPPRPEEGSPNEPIAGEPGRNPVQLLAELGHPGTAVEISRSDRRVTFGWLDDAGLVVERAEFNVQEGAWVHNSSTRCVSGEVKVDLGG